MKRIIVHNGTFHADDILCIAMCWNVYGKVPYIRKATVTNFELDDPDIFVCDVGRSYSPALANFDHHQDPKLPSSCVLLSRSLYKEAIHSILYDKLLRHVSDVDLGNITASSNSFFSIIRAFNGKQRGFSDALDIAFMVINTYVFNAHRSIDHKKKWSLLERHNGGSVVFQDDTETIMDWQEYAHKEGVIFLVTPSMRDVTQYQIISSDSTRFPIPEDKHQIFLHNSKFLAVYPGKDIAIERASLYSDMFKLI